MRIQSGFAAALLLAACQTPAVPQSVAPLPQNLVASAERSGAPGIVAAIYRDGRIVEAFTWGGALCDGAGSPNADAAHEIGSISKMMTAVAVLQLWEHGQVDLDASVGHYLEDIPEAWRAVTLRQLLTHTGGVPDYEEAGGYGVYETSPTPAEVYAIVASRPLDFESGARWSYSNTGYFLLSQVVQRVSGERFGDYLRERVFAPQGMHETFMGGYAPAGVVLAQGCKPGEGEGAARLNVVPITEASTFGAGGISSTIEDWAAWDDALRDGRLLSARGMTQLLTPQRLIDGEDTGYAFGVEVDEFRGVRRFGHSGQTQGFTALYQTFPDRGVGVMVFANSYGARPGPLLTALTLRVLPELSYDNLVAPADPDPTRTALISRSIRQAILVEQPLDLLGDDMRGFATDPRFASQRESLSGDVANARSFEYLRSETPPGADYVRHLYRMTTANGETAYFTVGWRNGVLHRLRWEDE